MLVVRLTIAILAIVSVLLSLSVMILASRDVCRLLFPNDTPSIGDSPLGAIACTNAMIMISLLKILLPLQIEPIWRATRVAGAATAVLWLCALGFTWGTVVICVLPLDPLPAGVAATAIAGWLVVEIASGLLPVIAVAPVKPQATVYATGPPTPAPLQNPPWFDVPGLLAHVFAHGAEGLDGLSLEGGVITCSQAALARHAGFSKTETHRQLRHLELQGIISLTTTRTGTKIRLLRSPTRPA